MRPRRASAQGLGPLPPQVWANQLVAIVDFFGANSAGRMRWQSFPLRSSGNNSSADDTTTILLDDIPALVVKHCAR